MSEEVRLFDFLVGCSLLELPDGLYLVVISSNWKLMFTVSFYWLFDPTTFVVFYLLCLIQNVVLLYDLVQTDGHIREIGNKTTKTTI